MNGKTVFIKNVYLLRIYKRLCDYYRFRFDFQIE